MVDASSPADGAPARRDAGPVDASARPGDAGPPPTLHIRELAGPGPWTRLEPSLAVTSEGIVFVTDGRNIYSIADGAASVYLAEEEIQRVHGATVVHVTSLALDPEGSVYALDTGGEAVLYVSDGPHRLSLFATTLRTPDGHGFPSQIAVDTPGEVLLLRERDGLVRVRADEVTRIYSADQLGGVDDCGALAFAARGGVFYYLGGCPGDPILIGTTAGGSLSTLMTEARAEAIFDNPYAVFGSLAARHSSGAVLNAGRGFLRVLDDGSYQIIRTEPSLSMFAPFAAQFPMAADAFDQIYLMAEGRIYRFER